MKFINMHYLEIIIYKTGSKITINKYFQQFHDHSCLQITNQWVYKETIKICQLSHQPQVDSNIASFLTSCYTQSFKLK